jgi:hypothetical protein
MVPKMKIMRVSPVNFVTGEMLDVRDINAALGYVRDATIFAARKRYNRSVIVIPFVTSVSSAYTHADIGTDKVQFRFTCPNTCVIERAYLNANMTCSAEVKVDITTTGGTTASGASSPWLSTDTAITDASVDTEDVSLDRVQLTAGTEYKITVSGGGAAVSMQRFDVILHVLTDRWTPSGTYIDQEEVARVSGLDPDTVTTAANVNAKNTLLSTYTGNFATYKTAPSPALFHIHGLTSTTDADLRTFRVPRFSSTTAQGKAVNLYVFALTGGAGSPGDTVTATLQNSAGSTLVTATADASGAAGWTTGSTGAISQSLVGAVSTEDSSSDYRIVLATNSAGTITKAHAILWVSR